MRWSAVLEVIKRILPFLESKAQEDSPDVLPTLRRVEHDVDVMRERLDIVVKDQGYIVQTLHEILAKFPDETP